MAPFEEHEVTYADDKKIFYLAAGPTNGPLLVFIHGWPAIGKLWKPQLDAFASLGFRVVAPDMPGERCHIWKQQSAKLTFTQAMAGPQQERSPRTMHRRT